MSKILERIEVGFTTWLSSQPIPLKASEEQATDRDKYIYVQGKRCIELMDMQQLNPSDDCETDTCGDDAR